MRLRLAIRAMMIVALAAALPAVGARADDQTVKVVVPFPAGGFMDVVARIASDRLAAILGNPVRPGT
jgi:tripartite-type tricarboxylate transporter receptor subunit TctC